jgi:hypothetical protein
VLYGTIVRLHTAEVQIIGVLDCLSDLQRFTGSVDTAPVLTHVDINKQRKADAVFGSNLRQRRRGNVYSLALPKCIAT